MVMVHAIQIFDSNIGEYRQATYKRTAEGIALLKENCTIILGTEEDVPAADVDEQGRYVPSSDS